MPKDSSEKIIDSPFAPATRSGTVSIGSGGGGGGGGATNLDALVDVTLIGAANGQVLTYNGGTGQWVNSAPVTGLIAHGLSSSYHTGLLNWSLINFAGSELDDIVTRPHSMLTGIGPNDHHNQSHVLATGTALGADHSISGAAAGEVLRATGATTAAFDVLHHTDLDNILPDQHHPFQHDIIGDVPGFGVAHSVVGADFTVVGVHPANTLALLPTSSAPGAAVSILKTDGNGAIQLDTDLLYVDGANNWIGVNRTPSGATLDVIAYSNADHTQRIKQKSGQTGRLWRIEDLSGNELIVLDSVGNLQSGRPGFVSGLLGWQITPQGNAEFNNLWCRGELHATVFVKDEVHATGGTLLVASAGTLHDDAVISSATVDDDVLVLYSTPAGQGVPLQVVTTEAAFTGAELHVSWVGNFININDPPSGPGFYFQPGDIVRSKTEVPTGVTDFWLEINSAVQYDGYATYSVFKRSGTDGTLPKGSAVVSYGKQGDGRIMLTSDLNYAPYIDVFTVGQDVWTGNAGSVLPRMRMGRLDGIGLPGVSGIEQYGMIAGKDLSDANSGYLIASSLQFSLYKVDIRLNNGVSDTGLWTADGNLRIGSNVGTDATTGLQVITTGARAGDVVIGNESSGYFLRWQQATGQLTVSGNLIISDPGGTVTKGYVDAQDSYYNGLATTGASNAQTNSQSYSDARRIVGVQGSWDSTGQSSISWGTKAAGGVALSAAFATGSTRTIADHAGATVNISARTYLYVSVAGTGAMTMAVTTSLAAVIGVNNVLIAVVDPGSAITKKCTITVVAGTTYMSGSNIFTGSITANEIAAQTITSAQIQGNTITSTQMNSAYTGTITAAQTTANTANSAAATADSKAVTAQNAAAAAQTTANNALTAAGDAQDYGNARRVVGVSGTWGSNAYNTIFWSGASVRFGDGTSKTLSAPTGGTGGNTPTFSGRVYFIINVNNAQPLAVAQVTSINSIGVDHALIAVAEAGTAATPGAPSTSGSGYATVQMMAGSTYISGDNIITGSIVSANLAASAITAGKIDALVITTRELATDAVTAAKINVANLQAVSTLTGALSVNGNVDISNTGAIRGNLKTYGSATAGFFLGYSGGYKFDVGDGNDYLRWDGLGLKISSSLPLDLASDQSNAIFKFTAPGGKTAQMFYDQGGNGRFEFSQPIRAVNLIAQSAVTIDSVSGSSGDVLKFTVPVGQANPGSDTFNYGRTGSQGYTSMLTYSGDVQIQRSVQVADLIVNGNSLRIGTPSSIPTHSTSPGESAGEIRWGGGYLYLWDGGQWWRTVMNSF